MHGDTTALAILDTGAGWLALDRGLLPRLDFAPPEGDGLARTPAPVTGLRLHGLETTPPQAAVSLDLEGMREATGRPLAALAGAALWLECAIVVDPRSDTLWVTGAPNEGGGVPDRIARSRTRLAGILSASARAVPFELRGDSKIVVRGTIEGRDSLRWIVDTGATKLTLFPGALRAAGIRLPPARELSGLLASTIDGEASVRYRRLGEAAITAIDGSVRAEGVDVALLETPLERALREVVGAPVQGVIGQSFLRRFRYAVDYGARVLWLEPLDVPRDERPHEYCTVGVQLARRADATTIEAVADRTPARDAGLRPGDQLLAIDGRSVTKMALIDADHALEGPPGSLVTLRVQRDGQTRDVRLRRRTLL